MTSPNVFPMYRLFYLHYYFLFRSRLARLDPTNAMCEDPPILPRRAKDLSRCVVEECICVAKQELSL